MKTLQYIVDGGRVVVPWLVAVLAMIGAWLWLAALWAAIGSMPIFVAADIPAPSNLAGWHRVYLVQAAVDILLVAAYLRRKYHHPTETTEI